MVRHSFVPVDGGWRVRFTVNDEVVMLCLPSWDGYADNSIGAVRKQAGVWLGNLRNARKKKKEGTLEKRYVYVILDTEVNERGEYRACVAVEGEKGYNRTDWFWGKDRKIAQQCADDRNEAVGISKQDAIKIVLGTMRK